jgi:hypothetical protein
MFFEPVESAVRIWNCAMHVWGNVIGLDHWVFSPLYLKEPTGIESCPKTWNVIDGFYTSYGIGVLLHRYRTCSDEFRCDGAWRVSIVEPAVLHRYLLVSSSRGAHPCFYFCAVGRETRLIAPFVCACGSFRYDRCAVSRT